jgi:hypothetical protein
MQSRKTVLLALGFAQRSDVTFTRETEFRIELFYLTGDDFMILDKASNIVTRQSFGSYFNNVPAEV